MDFLKVKTMPLSAYPEFPKAVILCIDDSEEVLECEKSFLESFGYTVLTAPSGGKGLEMASIYSVDVVIVDYIMPEMNGREVAIEMRRLRPQAPIIMLSGAVDVPEETLKLVDAFIAKDRLASQLLPAIVQLQNADVSLMHATPRASMA
jgi:two-component system cell cycle sensor histidine kinase/response regulator CckA